jgi:UDP-2,3-diacylglucosamine pyrophosphatase LpxH
MIQCWPPTDSIRRVTFVSDLHLMSQRSTAEVHRHAIATAIADADVCIWGGDLFDFRWSRVRGESASVDAALRWLDQWHRDFPDTHFVYLNGNHDEHAVFRTRLLEWASQHDRFDAGGECLRIGETLFLHGDVIQGDGSSDAFARYRQSWQAKPVASGLSSHLYQVAVSARVHKAAAMAAHRRRSTCARLLRWLRTMPREQTDGISQIVFGHTHRHLHGYHHGGVQFFNPGATVRHVAFRPVTLDV